MPRKPSTSICRQKDGRGWRDAPGLRLGFHRCTGLATEHGVDEFGVVERREDQVRGSRGGRMRFDSVDNETKQSRVRHRGPMVRR